MKILITEDDLQLQKILSRRFKQDGFSVNVAKDSKDCLNLINTHEYDCIILDIMLPTQNGFLILQTLRTKKINTPVILLTAKNSTSDRVKGLNMGADDYLTKPFFFNELTARVRRLLKRKSQKIVSILCMGDLSLNLITRKAKRKNKIFNLTVKEYLLLEYLLRNKGRILTKAQIAENICNYDLGYESTIVDIYIRQLRRKIDQNFKEKLIHNIRGVGYILRTKKAKASLQTE